MRWRQKDYIGKTFGKLTVIEYSKELKKYKCKCECGNYKYIIGRNLKIGNTISCGCAYIDKAQSQIVDNTRITQIGLYDQGTGRKHKKNTSGITGVYYKKRKKKWYAQLRFCGKVYFEGYFDNIEDAAKARYRLEELHQQKLGGESNDGPQA